MQLDKRWQVIDTENGRLLKGFEKYVEAEAFAHQQALANQNKMFAVLEVKIYFTSETKVKNLDVMDFVGEEEQANAEGN